MWMDVTDNNSHTSLFDRDTHDTHIIDSDTHDTHILDRDTHDTHILDNDTHDTHILDSDTHGAHIFDSGMITHTFHFLTRAHTHLTQSGTHSTHVHISPFDINQISNQPFWQTVASHKKKVMLDTMKPVQKHKDENSFRTQMFTNHLLSTPKPFKKGQQSLRDKSHFIRTFT